MSDSLLSELQKAANAALKSHDVHEGMKHLAKAFGLFSQETHRLEGAYGRLQEKFTHVNVELENTNSELRNKLEELNTVSTYLHNILKNMNQGILFIDAEGSITTLNEAAEQILQVDKKKVLFDSFWNHFSDDFFGFSIKRALVLKLSQKISYITLTTKEQSKKEIEISTNFLHESPIPYQGIIILLRDITQIQNLQLIASRNDRMKKLGEMAASMAHEIRNPLGGIRGFASLLYRDLKDSKHLQEMAGFIVEGTKTLERLVNNVLHFSRPIEIQSTSENISSFLKGILKFIKVDPSFSSQVQIELHISQDPFIVFFDTQYLKAALLNLFANAYQSIEDEGKIIVSVLRSNDFCVITISDTGRGIDEKNLENIFSPFFTTKQNGNGLGLSETYKIIQAHCGTIDVHSKRGSGTTFSIKLPLKR